MKIQDEDDFGDCPKCGEGHFLAVIQEWVSMHDKEVLLHCCDCDSIYLVYYKFHKIVELKPEEIKKE